MIERGKQKLLQALKIPEVPHIPPDEEGHAEIFRPGTPYLLYLRLFWLPKQVLGLLALAGSAFWWHDWFLRSTSRLGFFTPETWYTIYLATETIAVIAFVGQALATWIALRWNYERRFYVLTDRCLRIQEGTWTFHERTFTLSRLQQVSLQQNPLQRLLGLSDIVVTTAGGGSKSKDEESGGMEESLHKGHLCGLVNPIPVREHLVARMKAHLDGGLGDEASKRSESPPELLNAIQTVRKEIQGLTALGSSLGAMPKPMVPRGFDPATFAGSQIPPNNPRR